MKKEDMIVIALLVIVLIVVGFTFFTLINPSWVSSGNQAVGSYQEAISSEQENICATPFGYTDEQWREHMGHHPDRYAECFS